MEEKLNRIVGVTLLFLFLPGLAAAEGRFERFDFKLDGEITDLITEDLNGDGLPEAIAVHVDANLDPPGRYLTIFTQIPDRGFELDNKIEWTFPPEVATIDVGDVGPEPGRELVFITERGVSYASVRQGRVGPLTELVSVLSVVASAYERGVPYYNFVRDYTGDGRDDILVVGFLDALFARQEENYQFSTRKISLRPSMDIQAWDVGKLLGDSEHPMFRVAYFVPEIHSLDTNADGLSDLVINTRNNILVFTQDENGFSEQPAQTYKLEIFKGKEKKNRHQGAPPNYSFNDLDRDGRLDIVASQTQGTFGSLESRTLLFRGNGDSLKKGRPDMEFKNNDTVMSLFVRDVNKDGRDDLIMPTMDLGAWTAGKVLLTGGMSVKWNYFIQRPDASFSPTPDRSFTTVLKFNISKFRLESGVPNVFGDFNGDGYPDQAVGEDKDLLVIRLRDADGNLMDLEERLNVPVSMFNRAVDMNNDGMTDIVINYEDQSDYVSEFHIFLNRGPWVPGN